MPDARPILIDLPSQLESERIVLRPWHDTDAEAFFALVDKSRAHIRRWLPWPDDYQSVDDAHAFLRRQEARWIAREDLAMGIFDRGGQLLGSVAMHPTDWRTPSFEVGYWIGAPHAGRGYVSEAVRIVTELAFDRLGAQRIVIRCDAENERSAAVARRCGYAHEGTMRSDHRERDGRLRDTMIFARILGTHGVD
jgi:RimJ/RimL family protein N-acetyltransferase